MEHDWAIDRLKDMLDEADQSFDIDALELAIKSLEAWEKVKEEISEAYKDFQNDDTCIANGINICRRIIDKHLKELELN